MDGAQIGVYKTTNESVAHFSQFISRKGKKNSRQSKAQSGEAKQSRLRKNDGFLMKQNEMK